MQLEIANRKRLVDPSTCVDRALAMGLGVGGLGLGLGSGANAKPFSPSQIAGLALWLRADLGVTLNAGNVSAWADQSGSGASSATQGTAANQPAWSAVGGANGRPAIVFNGTTNYLSFSGLGSPQAAYSIFAVVTASFTVQLPVWSTRLNAAPGSGTTTFFGTTAARQTFAYQGGVAPSASVITAAQMSTSNPHILELVADNAAGTRVVRFDGANGVSDSGDAGLATYLAGGELGRDSGAVFAMTLMELIQYSSALSSTNRASVERYLGNRYGIAVP